MSDHTLIVCDADDCTEMYTTDYGMPPFLARHQAAGDGWTYPVVDDQMLDRCPNCTKTAS